VPEGADAVEAAFDYLGTASKEGYTAAASMTPKLAILNWHLVLLYPKGQPVREQQVRARLTVPSGWQLGTAVPIEGTRNDLIQFQTVSLETLVDSPVLCGAYFKQIPIGPKEGPSHYLVLACDTPGGLEISSALKENHDRLIAEASELFGSPHYRSYRFLVALTDHIRTDGIEHHECSDNRLPERFFVDETYRKNWGTWLLPHEYTHSWNGKYRRPDGLATSDFQEPMKTRLLWVYEGLTQYLGFVLAARSGLTAPEVSRENFAVIADWAGSQQGRTWRPLVDTTVTAPFLYSARPDWAARRRGVDFYDEGALLWLDVDTLIREKTGGKKSLDDFCRAFFGGKSSAPEVKPYTFDDVVTALNTVVEHDWKGLLEKRLNDLAAAPPLDGLKRGGWTVTYRATPGDFFKAHDDDEKQINLGPSIGLLLKDDGQIIDVIPGKAADKAGVGPGMKVIAINERRFTAERMRQAVAATKDGKAQLVLLLENQDYFKSFTLPYADGDRYPALTRDDSKTDLLSEILRSRTGK
jgi:predicted metalloprotease with PDZ domain